MTRMVTNSTSRRGALGGLVGAAVSPFLSIDEAAAATAEATANFFGTARYGSQPAAIAAGEVSTAAGALFSIDDAVGNLIYRERTAEGSVEVARCVTPAALASPDPEQGVGLVNGAVQYRASIDDLSRAPRTSQSAILSELGRAGLFTWNPDECSTEVSNDPRQGIWVAPASDPTGKSGAWVRDVKGAIPAAAFGMSADATEAENTAAFKAAVDYVRLFGGALELPAGHLRIGESITIEPIPETSGADRLFSMAGQGSGKRGSWLHFSRGSLIVEASHQLSGFHVTSDDGDGIVIRPKYQTRTAYPTRSGLRDVRAERCRGSGITIEDTWNYLMENVYARYNKKWGVEGKKGKNFGLSSNVWTIMGGEFQGNGTRAGIRMGLLGSSERATGGGIYTGKAIQLAIIGAAIQGNVGDGLKLGPEMRGLSLISVYFEKNGSHYTNCDVCNDPPPSTALGPSNLFILNSNFTPQNYNGTIQERAMDLYDVASLRIVNPVFFASSASSKASGYTYPPIRIRETQGGRSTGWIEDPHSGWSGYGCVLDNETERFGKPTVHRFSPNQVMAGQTDTASQRFYVPVSHHAGRRVDVAHFTRPNARIADSRIARFMTSIMYGPLGTLFSQPAQFVTYSSINAVATRHHSKHPSIPSSEEIQGSAEVMIRRTGGHPEDTLSADVMLLAVEIVTYEGVVGTT